MCEQLDAIKWNILNKNIVHQDLKYFKIWFQSNFSTLIYFPNSNPP